MRLWGRLAFAAAAGGVVLVALLVFLWFETGPPGPDEALRVFTARKILTMDPAHPTATAVAVAAGRIVAVGSLDEVRASLADRPFEVEETFRNEVLLPGFVEPHFHPTLAATILPMEIVSAMPWTTPRGRTQPVRGHEAFLRRLRERDAALTHGGQPEAWLKVWGYHAPYHGALSRRDLDAISTTRPIFVWQRSVHEMFFNTRALETLGMSRAAFDAHPQASWEDGHLWERGTLSLGRPMMRVLASPGSYRRGLAMMSQVIHRGGLTTVAEQGSPQVSFPAELATLALAMHRRETPYRFALVPNAMFLLRQEGNADAAERAATRMRRWSSDRIRIPHHAKYYADGAIFSQLMQMSEPYTDGHHGEWMMTPEEQWSVLSTFWKRGWNIHVHVNGDAGLDGILGQVARLRASDPRPGIRFVLEHYGYARADQHARVRALGMAVSNNPYYVHELAPIYASHGLGPERAAKISPLGSLARAGVRISLHSDFPMAPAEPLTLVWAAVNRIGSDGKVWGPEERLPLALALRAVTIEAAWSIGMEQEIGSIEVGKRADFTALDADPHEVAPEAIRDIGIWGTVLDGRLHPIQ